jgi:hypothetical protein
MMEYRRKLMPVFDSLENRQPATPPPITGRTARGLVAPTSGRIFLLSPANPSGKRGTLILSESARSGLPSQIQKDGSALGELFSFISGLYFRGKLAYARAYMQAPPRLPGIFVITSCLGLVQPERIITAAELREMRDVPIDPSNAFYRDPLMRDARRISALAGQECEFVLLGSIATPKYVEPLLTILGEQLVFPREFVGRGDMSRGGLMLRCVRAGMQLNYIPVATAVRHGRRPAKLSNLTSLD